MTEKQANEAIDSDPYKLFLKPEQEVRNYFLALNFLEEKLKKKELFSKELILEVQAIVEKGAGKEKTGLRFERRGISKVIMIFYNRRLHRLRKLS